jgi:hypothetical protein
MSWAWLVLAAVACAQETSESEADFVGPEVPVELYLDPQSAALTTADRAAPEVVLQALHAGPPPDDLEEQVDLQIERVEALIRAMEQLHPDDQPDDQQPPHDDHEPAQPLPAAITDDDEPT